MCRTGDAFNLGAQFCKSSLSAATASQGRCGCCRWPERSPRCSARPWRGPAALAALQPSCCPRSTPSCTCSGWRSRTRPPSRLRRWSRGGTWTHSSALGSSLACAEQSNGRYTGIPRSNAHRSMVCSSQRAPGCPCTAPERSLQHTRGERAHTEHRKGPDRGQHISKTH